MRTLILSDHTADQQHARAAQRETDYALDMETYKLQIKRRAAGLRLRRQALAVAFRERRLAQTIIKLFSYISALVALGPRMPMQRQPDRDEIVWASGREGEHRVAALLGEMLNDDWTLLAGYCNARGEIDQILVGPGGLFALEIKFTNGIVHCNGDSWWRDKYDRYGNLVETAVPIADRGGRGPSLQVNSAADALQQFLDRKHNGVRVSRAVILAHQNSQLGQIRNQTVQFVGTLDKRNIKAMLAGPSRPLDASSVRVVIETIRRDHEFHHKRRLSRGAYRRTE